MISLVSLKAEGYLLQVLRYNRSRPGRYWMPGTEPGTYHVVWRLRASRRLPINCLSLSLGYTREIELDDLSQTEDPTVFPVDIRCSMPRWVKVCMVHAGSRSYVTYIYPTSPLSSDSEPCPSYHRQLLDRELARYRTSTWTPSS